MLSRERQTVKQFFFLEILRKADEWEERFALKPGIISAPMRVLLEGFFKGLIQPLNITSQEYVALMTTDESFEQRLEETQEQSLAAVYELASCESQLDKLQHFVRMLEHHQARLPSSVLPFWDDITRLLGYANPAEDNLLAYYEKYIYPILVEHKETLDAVEAQFVDKERYRLELTSLSPAPDVAVEETMALIEAKMNLGKEMSIDFIHSKSIACLKHFEQMQMHLRGKCEALKEKQAYIAATKDAFDVNNEVFIKDYKISVFKTVMHDISTFDFNMPFYKEKFNEQLCQHLEHNWPEISAKVRDIEDIPSAIRARTRRIVYDYKKPFDHLVKIKTAIQNYEAYFESANDWFETPETLDVKKQEITFIRNIANDETLAPDERVRQVIDHVASDSFQKSMLDHTVGNYSGLARLYALLNYLLEGLGLQTLTPTYRCLSDGMAAAVAEAPAPVSLSGLFANKQKRRYEPPCVPGNVDDEVQGGAAAPVPSSSK